MRTVDRSLHVQVEKWLGSVSSLQTRVTRFSRSAQNPWRCVRVEALRGSGTLSIVFFRHDDGSWCVFPPQGRRLTMNVAQGIAS
jgi:hypothetical protein